MLSMAMVLVGGDPISRNGIMYNVVVTWLGHREKVAKIFWFLRGSVSLWKQVKRQIKEKIDLEINYRNLLYLARTDPTNSDC